MAQPISVVNSAADTFQVWVNRTNEVINAVSTVIVTANNDANGAVTTGNAQVVGTVSCLVLAANTVRGGNVQTARTMNVVSNVVIYEGLLTIGNSTINVTSNSTTISSANLIASATLVVGANAYINTTAQFIGNSTVNAVVNSTSVVVSRTTGPNVATATLTAVTDSLYGSLELGGNVGGYIDFKQPASDDFDYRLLGNSSGLFLLVNSSSTANLIQTVGSNVSLGTNSLFVAHTTNTVTFSNTIIIGNSTVNVVANNTMIKLSNSTVNTAIAVPSGAQYSATNVFLHANGQWVQATVGTAPSVSDSNTLIDFATFTTSGTSAQVITSYTKAAYRAGEFFVSVKDNAANAYHSTKMLVLHDDNNTDAYATEYGVLISNTSLGTFLANCNTTHVKLNFTPTVAATTVKMIRNLIT